MPNEARVENCKPKESVSLHKVENIYDAQNVFTEPVQSQNNSKCPDAS